MQSFLSVLRIMFGCSVDVTSDNFVLLHEVNSLMFLFILISFTIKKCKFHWNPVPFRNIMHVRALQRPAKKIVSI